MFEFPPIMKQDDHVLIKETVIQAVHYTVFLDKDIVEPDQYRELITLLLTANEVDAIDLMINSNGGSLSTCNAIVQSIKSCKASVRAVIMGDCHSAASIIALNCDSALVMDSAEMMIHTAQFVLGGATGNVSNQIDFVSKQVSKLLDETYKGFLTAKEISQVKMGVELYFGAEEIRKRLVKLKRS